MSSPALSEALEATHLNVEVDDPKLYHVNCVDVIANKVADGSVDLVLNDPRRGCFRPKKTLRNEPGVIIHPEWTQMLLLRRQINE